MEFDETEMKDHERKDDDKMLIKSGDSIQNALWINPNERDIEDLKK